MGSKERWNDRLRWGAFEADVRAGELYKTGKKVKIQLLPMQVLAALLEKAGEIVTREELRAKIWPADTFVDFEHGLNTAIKKLRQALGENPRQPKYIETLPKRGYRFVGKVEGKPGPAVKLGNPGQLAGRVFEVTSEEGLECVIVPANEEALAEWERLKKLGDDVGVSMMITEKRLLLVEAGKSVRLLGALAAVGWYEARILEGEHYGKTALLQRKALKDSGTQGRRRG